MKHRAAPFKLPRSATFAALAALASSLPAPLLAEPKVDAAAAEALFNEARKLEKAGDKAAACEKFGESYKLDPAPGTLLNVAECSRQAGRTATAWGQFLEAERLFRRRGDDRRAAFAQGQAAELEPRLARVRVVAAVELPTLELRRDGVELSAAALGAELPVDPGEHSLVAEAVGHRAEELRFVAVEGQLVEVTIPALERLPDELPPEPRTGSGVSGPSEAGPWRTVGWVLGGVGVASLLAGGVFVGLTAERTGAADERCPGKVCDAEGFAIVGEAETYANVANVTIIGGAVLASAGLALLLFAPSDDGSEEAASYRLAPMVGPGSAGLWWSGSF